MGRKKLRILYSVWITVFVDKISTINAYKILKQYCFQSPLKKKSQ